MIFHLILKFSSNLFLTNFLLNVIVMIIMSFWKALRIYYDDKLKTEIHNVTISKKDKSTS